MRSLKAHLILSRLRVFNALTTFCFQVSDHFRAAFISPLHPIQLVILHDPKKKEQIYPPPQSCVHCELISCEAH